MITFFLTFLGFSLLAGIIQFLVTVFNSKRKIVNAVIGFVLLSLLASVVRFLVAG